MYGEWDGGCREVTMTCFLPGGILYHKNIYGFLGDFEIVFLMGSKIEKTCVHQDETLPISSLSDNSLMKI